MLGIYNRPSLSRKILLLPVSNFTLPIYFVTIILQPLSSNFVAACVLIMTAKLPARPDAGWYKGRNKSWAGSTISSFGEGDVTVG